MKLGDPIMIGSLVQIKIGCAYSGCWGILLGTGVRDAGVCGPPPKNLWCHVYVMGDVATYGAVNVTMLQECP